MGVRRTSVVATRWRRGLAVVAVVSLVGIAAATGAGTRVAEFVLRLRTRMAVERLVTSLRPEQRPTARFSALGVSAVQATMRGGPSSDLGRKTRSSEVLDVAGSSSAPEAVAAAAAALAVGGGERQAVLALQAATARTPDDARLWNDLAAAQLQAGHPRLALVAADHALRIDPRSADALYNRGLALERLGLSSVAAESWRECLLASPDAELAEQLRQRLRVTEKPTEQERWTLAEPELQRAEAAGDTAAVARFAAEFPRRVRAYAETPYLQAWAAAVEAGDAAKAEEWLRMVRTAGQALRGRGETLLGDSVAAIDEALATRDTARVRLLFSAQLSYDRGRQLCMVRDYAAAEKELHQAEAAFTAARTPMAAVPRVWIASTLTDRARTDEAREMLTGVIVAEQAMRGHRAVVAHAQYLLSMCEMYAGRWNAAVDAAKASAVGYRALGELSSAGDSEAMLAVILTLLGQPDEAWEYRERAFHLANDTGVANRTLLTVATGTRAAMQEHDRELALSLLDVEMTLAAEVRDPSIAADMLTRRVELQHERGAFDDRDTALARGRIAIGAVKDPAERTRLTIELDAAEALALRNANPRRSAEMLGRAVAFSRAVDRRPYLPGILLQRGRAYRAAGDDVAAWKDYSDAMDELEAQRGAIADVSLRSRMLDTADELFTDALALQVARGDAEAAFAVAERARARSLLDVAGGAPRPVASSVTIAGRLPGGTLVLEYALLPEALVVFAIDARGLRMHTVPVKTEALSPDRADLGELLLGAVRDELTAATKVVFIPDKILQRVPFASLRREGRYLVTTHTISVVPSASLLALGPVPIGPKERSVLIVGNPAADPELKLGMLPSVEREVSSVGTIYRPAKVLFGADATKPRFAAEAPAYDVIHFAGHGVSDDESLTASLLFARRGTDPGRMDTSEIEKLRLTRGPLVVLAACGTLRGRARGVEGMPSLARSFLAAGAMTVIGTLWNVDDAQSGALMTAFHREIASGEPPATALRNAQLRALARGGADADTKNWAAFVVYTVKP
jgi:tetratricopeptide (TPR) repeat protein